MPLIGITASRSPSRDESGFLNISEKYLRIVTRAGGFPLVLPYGVNLVDCEDALARLDGILLTGGGDIETGIFNGKPSVYVSEVDSLRDSFELAVARFACQRTMPILGICRGLQVVNVALGGSLHTDLCESGFLEIRHEQGPDGSRDFLAHSIQLLPGSQLANICGCETAWVNSFHHQGIAGLPAALVAAAVSPDGLVEAVELRNHPFGMGVQWHPECLPDSALTLGIMNAFIEAAAGYRRSRQPRHFGEA